VTGASGSGETLRFRFEPGPDDEQRPRVDHFLGHVLAGRDLPLTRSQLKRLIDDGAVSVSGRVVAKPGHKLVPGDEIEVRVPPPAPAQAAAQAMDLDVLYEDEHIIVIDKPAGLVVHPAPGHPDSTLVNALLAHCHDLSGIGGELRPGIVHRLDKDTSGVMVATKTDVAHVALAEVFHAHRLEREYIALVAPPPAPGTQQGTFSTLHGRHPVHRKKFTSRVERGKPAITHWRVERHFGPGREAAAVAAQVRCRLETGRTHQIRVHLSEHGMPVIGDPLYGHRYRDPELAALAHELGRQALHAAVLGFAHPVTGAPLRFESPMPADMQSLALRLAKLGQRA
jgi:23S rRNA pseudouridine1911/1915/1917 synthase